MLRASACHNYSPEPDDSAAVNAKAFIQGGIQGQSWLNSGGFEG
jgi:hypothetical protein